MEGKRLKLTHVRCCVCGTNDAQRIGVGKDYEYKTSGDSFAAFRCLSCELVYLNPRPDVAEFEQIYPANYHAFNFSEKQFGVIYKVRARLEAKRLLRWCENLPTDARILDVGCGDGFHLNLLKRYGGKLWTLEGVDVDKRAVRMAEKSSLKVHLGTIEAIDLPENSFDLAIMIQTDRARRKTFRNFIGGEKLLETGRQTRDCD
jgi:SAM-dependent methyltransferase